MLAALLIFDVFMLLDAIQRPPEHFSTPDAKTWWIVALVVGLVTALPAIVVAIAYNVSVRLPAERGQRPATGAAAPESPSTPDSASKYCRNCGAKLAAGARFCHSCGAPTT
jgi:hypothetical protein